jgi:hypothetical protein
MEEGNVQYVDSPVTVSSVLQTELQVELMGRYVGIYMDSFSI